MRKFVLIVGLATSLLSSLGVAATTKKFQTLDAAILDQVKQWQQTGKIKPIMSDDGKLIFPFGEYMPKLVCGTLRACDVELEPGEKVMGDVRGDTKLWDIDKGKSMIDENQDKVVTHVIFKPKLNGIKSNVIIFTNRRTYHIELISPQTEGGAYMNRVGFYYPNKLVDRWEEEEVVAAAKKKEDDDRTIAEFPSMTVDNLDFDYKITGSDPRITPVRVFNDGTRVWVQFPQLMTKTEAPSLYLLDEKGDMQMVNFRPVKGGYFVVDKLFDRAQIVLGPQGESSKVSIVWNKTKKWWW
ncbi:TrbG/VirB9 family P-type conjugative transfer protein [Chromobacterium piscinae]|uniref:TrbG/VirB9 family P-type conjugative transfer protein n=1 Tax=Chromobacterium piscinae TaxID=686831 RepID=UPI001E5BC009|nr:TrbG/VirB9 family P-type conjugative transfer protein [Chromobacterium piscinae]MCD5327932.1 TrbG/VirB9 family P-type conjugative transfer protein [Chromobacterium piscinae]